MSDLLLSFVSASDERAFDSRPLSPNDTVVFDGRLTPPGEESDFPHSAPELEARRVLHRPIDLQRVAELLIQETKNAYTSATLWRPREFDRVGNPATVTGPPVAGPSAPTQSNEDEGLADDEDEGKGDDYGEELTGEGQEDDNGERLTGEEPTYEDQAPTIHQAQAGAPTLTDQDRVYDNFNQSSTIEAGIKPQSHRKKSRAQSQKTEKISLPYDDSRVVLKVLENFDYFVIPHIGHGGQIQLAQTNDLTTETMITIVKLLRRGGVRITCSTKHAYQNENGRLMTKGRISSYVKGDTCLETVHNALSESRMPEDIDYNELKEVAKKWLGVVGRHQSRGQDSSSSTALGYHLTIPKSTSNQLLVDVKIQYPPLTTSKLNICTPTDIFLTTDVIDGFLDFIDGLNGFAVEEFALSLEDTLRNPVVEANEEGQGSRKGKEKERVEERTEGTKGTDQSTNLWLPGGILRRIGHLMSIEYLIRSEDKGFMNIVLNNRTYGDLKDKTIEHAIWYLGYGAFNAMVRDRIDEVARTTEKGKELDVWFQGFSGIAQNLLVKHIEDFRSEESGLQYSGRVPSTFDWDEVLRNPYFEPISDHLKKLDTRQAYQSKFKQDPN